MTKNSDIGSQSAAFYPLQLSGHLPILKKRSFILKPLQPKEYRFYNDLSKHTKLLQYIPTFYGVTHLLEHATIQEENAPFTTSFSFALAQREVSLSRPYIVLQDVSSGFVNPCMLDLKLGFTQIDDETPPEKLATQQAKCEKSTSSAIGIRIGGIFARFYENESDSKSDQVVYRNKYWGRMLTPLLLKQALFSFLHNGIVFHAEICKSILHQLIEIRDSYIKESSIILIGVSLLILYDFPQILCSSSSSSVNSSSACTKVRLIDFGSSSHRNHSETENSTGFFEGISFIIDTLQSFLEQVEGKTVTFPILWGSEEDTKMRLASESELHAVQEKKIERREKRAKDAALHSKSQSDSDFSSESAYVQSSWRIVPLSLAMKYPT